jgi:hypothetical protein
MRTKIKLSFARKREPRVVMLESILQASARHSKRLQALGSRLRGNDKFNLVGDSLSSVTSVSPC